MKILWLVSDYLSPKQLSHKSGYNGGGWIASLLKVVRKDNRFSLTVVYLADSKEAISLEHNGVKYIPIQKKGKNIFKKVRDHYFKFRHDDAFVYNDALLSIIKNNSPQVVHLWGIETKMAGILATCEVPIVVHLQGLLTPLLNVYYPPSCSEFTFLRTLPIKELFGKNGFRHRKRTVEERSKTEQELFKKVLYCMGRTDWDYQVSRLLAPKSQYFHVDEMLRDAFYKHAGEWNVHKRGKMIILTTSSDASYKGIDDIVKTAALLKKHTDIDYEWRIAGVNMASDIIHFLQKWMKTDFEEYNIKFLGVLNEEEVCSHLLDADVYVQPSYIENSPNSLCEAQMIGVPVIATFVGGVSSLVEHRRNGILVPANDPFALAMLAVEVFQNKEMSTELSRNAVITARERHNPQIILRDLSFVYQTVSMNGYDKTC